MAKVKLADKREIPKIPLKQVSVERAGSPYLSRVEQQHIREGELTTQKLRNVRSATTLAANTFTLGSNSGLIITTILTANDASVIIPLPPQFDIFVDNDKDLASLWDLGKLTSGSVNLQLGMVQHINTSFSGLSANQSSASLIITNRDTISHTYYVYNRWIYLIDQI